MSTQSVHRYLLIAVLGVLPTCAQDTLRSTNANPDALKALAVKGDIKAQVNLGYACFVAKDYEQAAKWFGKAADQGLTGPESSYAYYALGTMYQQGLGVPQDSVQALMWSAISAALGNQSALTTRETIASTMSAAQVNEARSLAKQWLLARGLQRTQGDEPPDLAAKYPELADVLGDPLIAGELPGLQNPNPMISGAAYHRIGAYKAQKLKQAQEIALLKQKLEAMGIDISKLPLKQKLEYMGIDISKLREDTQELIQPGSDSADLIKGLPSIVKNEPSLSVSRTLNHQRTSLKGLQAVAVDIEVLGEQKLIDRNALGELLVQAQLRLRQDGIKVQDNVDAVPGRPILEIALDFYDIGKNSATLQGYAFTAICELWQDGHLDRNQSAGKVVTWYTLMTGTGNSAVVEDQSKKTIAELLDVFVNAFLAENPR